MGSIENLFTGRLGRLHYFLGTLVILGFGLFAFFIYPSAFLSFVFSLLTLPLVARRLHDVGLSGYLAPLSILSYFGSIGTLVSVAFNLFLLFKRGDEEANKYGPPPSKDIKFIDAILSRSDSSGLMNTKKIDITKKLPLFAFLLSILIIFMEQSSFVGCSFFSDVECSATIITMSVGLILGFSVMALIPTTLLFLVTKEKTKKNFLKLFSFMFLGVTIFQVFYVTPNISAPPSG